VPIISTFFGIIVRMYFQEHEPAHFHVEYQGQVASVDFTGHIIRGQIRSATARRLVAEWAAIHRVQLEQNWANMKVGRPLEKIEPLQ
jgi:hypothetical protein